MIIPLKAFYALNSARLALKNREIQLKPCQYGFARGQEGFFRAALVLHWLSAPAVFPQAAAMLVGVMAYIQCLARAPLAFWLNRP